MTGTHTYLRLRRYLSRWGAERRLKQLPLLQRLVGTIDRQLLRLYPPDVRLRHEFNRWVDNGKGKSMHSDHLWFTEKALARLVRNGNDRILDLGCGEGWACRLLCDLQPQR